MSDLWNQKGFPHKGWRCTAVEDLGTGEHTCEMCGREEIRYVHVVRHAEVANEISVGCVCAEKLEEDYSGAVARREAPLRSRAARREKWCLLKNWTPTPKGGWRLRKEGAVFSVSASGSRWYASVLPPAQFQTTLGKWWSVGTFSTVVEAKLALFDKIWPARISL